MKTEEVPVKMIGLALAILIGCNAVCVAEAMKAKQTDKPAIVFMVAGQSNAGGCGVLSPELHKQLGRDKKRPLVPGSTAKEVGLSTDPADYTHSYIWVPDIGFERIDPARNCRPIKLDKPKMHGMELPVRDTVEQTINELLDAEADRLCNAQRYEHTEARTDTRAGSYPREHWRGIRTNNMLERLMREIRHRTNVVGCFPDGNSALMLAAARLRQIAGTKWSTYRYLSMKRLKDQQTQQQQQVLEVAG